MSGLVSLALDRITGDARERHRRAMEAAVVESNRLQAEANELKRREVEALEKLAASSSVSLHQH